MGNSAEMRHKDARHNCVHHVSLAHAETIADPTGMSSQSFACLPNRFRRILEAIATRANSLLLRKVWQSHSRNSLSAECQILRG